MARPRIRTLKPEFFQDEKINAVCRDARYLAIGLVTLADDRGRLRAMLPAVTGHVYPMGDVTFKQVEKWLQEIVATGFAVAYEVAPVPYLWLPNFWRHQVINKPSESELPAHPDDMLANLAIDEAIRTYRKPKSVIDPGELPESSRINPVGVTPPRVGARSVPFPSLPESLPTGVARDPAIPEGDHPTVVRLRETVEILSTSQRGWMDPERVGVLNTLAANPDADHKAAAHLAVADMADPAFRTTNAAKALQYAFERQARGGLFNGQRPRQTRQPRTDRPNYDAKAEVLQ